MVSRSCCWKKSRGTILISFLCCSAVVMFPVMMTIAGFFFFFFEIQIFVFFSDAHSSDIRFAVYLMIEKSWIAKKESFSCREYNLDLLL